MKKIFFTLTILLLSINLTFAQKCKPRYKKKDSFTGIKAEFWGNTMTSMSVSSFGILFSPKMYATKVNGEDKLIFWLDFSNKLRNYEDQKAEGHSWFEKGSKISIRYGDNSFEEFIVEDVAINNAGYSSAKITMPVTQEQIKKMSENIIEKVRINPFVDNSDDYLQFSVSKGRFKKVQKQLVCYLKL